MKKTLLIFVSVIMLLVLTACKEESAMPETPDFSVEATATAADAGKSAADILIAAMDEQGITYTVDNGTFDNIGGYTSTDSEGWCLYYNDELATIGAADITLAEGDTVAFRWEDYSVFNDSIGDEKNANDEGADE